MAKVEGQGIKSRGSYVAKEAMAKGLYWLHELEQAQEPRAPGVKVRLSLEVVALVGVASENGKNRTLRVNVSGLSRRRRSKDVRKMQKPSYLDAIFFGGLTPD